MAPGLFDSDENIMVGGIMVGEIRPEVRAMGGANSNSIYTICPTILHLLKILLPSRHLMEDQATASHHCLAFSACNCKQDKLRHHDSIPKIIKHLENFSKRNRYIFFTAS